LTRAATFLNQGTLLGLVTVHLSAQTQKRGATNIQNEGRNKGTDEIKDQQPNANNEPAAYMEKMQTVAK
jgi:hypothetical protein